MPEPVAVGATEAWMEAPGIWIASALFTVVCNCAARPARDCGKGDPLEKTLTVSGNGDGAVVGEETLIITPKSAVATAVPPPSAVFTAVLVIVVPTIPVTTGAPAGDPATAALTNCEPLSGSL